MNKKFTFIKKSSLALAFSLATLSAATANASGLQTQMDKIFGDMSNVTAPGAYKSQRRGVLTAGRVTQKSKLFDENLIGFSPPSWKAGCGGVDLYGGALSFISKDQIVALLRAVAANAKGYFFQLALSNVCPQCSTHIETFQKKIQQLNQFLGNSCQLAQGLVNDASDLLPFDNKYKTGQGLKSMAGGFVDDFFETRQQNEGESATKVMHDKDPVKAKEATGNLTWKQLKLNSASSWFLGGDNPLLEAILSLSGSIIIGSPKADETGDDSTPTHQVPGYQITLSDLIYGGDLKIYDCSSDRAECAGNNGVLNKKTVEIIGFKEKIDNMLLGTDSTNGLINKYVNHSAHGGLSTDEMAFLETLPSGVGSIIRQLSTLSPDAAQMFAMEASGAISLSIVHDMTQGLFRSARLALANSKSDFRSKAIKELNSSQKLMQQEYAVLGRDLGSLSGLMAYYNNLIENVRKQRYTLQSLTKPPQKGITGNTQSRQEP